MTRSLSGSPQEGLGLIAGHGRLPLLYARSLKAQGYRIFCAAIREETEPAIEGLVDTCRWLWLGQLGKLIEAFREAGVGQAVMVGKVHKTRLYKLRPDWQGLRLMAGAPDYADDTLLGAVADELERHGIRLVSSIEHAGELLPGAGVLTARLPSSQERRDLAFGWPIAKEVAGLDVGQSVVVKDRSVIAVEAVEGTDGAIERGGYLAGPGTTVVKVAKPNQDLRFDVPTVGPDTVITMERVGARCLALEADLTLVLDQDKLVADADKAGISMILEHSPMDAGEPIPEL